MTNKQPQIVNINGKEHKLEDLSNQARLLIDHVADLERKIARIDFQRQQLQVGRDALFGMLNQELENPAEYQEQSAK